MSSSSLQSDAYARPRARDLLRSVVGPLVALALVVGVFTIADNLQEDGGRFATLRNAQTVLVQAATVAVAALGMTMIIVAGGIDLSAGTAMALSATVLALFLREDFARPWPSRRPWRPAAWPASSMARWSACCGSCRSSLPWAR